MDRSMNKPKKELVIKLKERLDNINNLSILAYDVEQRMEDDGKDGVSETESLNHILEEIWTAYQPITVDLFEMGFIQEQLSEI